MSEATSMLIDGAQTNQADTSTVDAVQAAETTQQPQTTEATPEKVAEKVSDIPEKYDIKAPEGVTFDTELVGEFEGIAKELGLSQVNAQKVSDIGAKLAQKLEAKQLDAITQLNSQWVETAKADKEYGGAKLQENLAVAQKALTSFGTPELRDLLEKTGMGNNPEVIRFMYRAGMAISEDKLVTGGAATTVAPSAAQRLFPNMNP